MVFSSPASCRWWWPPLTGTTSRRRCSPWSGPSPPGARPPTTHHLNYPHPLQHVGGRGHPLLPPCRLIKEWCGLPCRGVKKLNFKGSPILNYPTLYLHYIPAVRVPAIVLLLPKVGLLSRNVRIRAALHSSCQHQNKVRWQIKPWPLSPTVRWRWIRVCLVQVCRAYSAQQPGGLSGGLVVASGAVAALRLAQVRGESTRWTLARWSW